MSRNWLQQRLLPFFLHRACYLQPSLLNLYNLCRWMNRPRPSYFDKLPDDMILEILKHLESPLLTSAVSKGFYRISQDLSLIPSVSRYLSPHTNELIGKVDSACTFQATAYHQLLQELKVVDQVFKTSDISSQLGIDLHTPSSYANAERLIDATTTILFHHQKLRFVDEYALAPLDSVSIPSILKKGSDIHSLFDNPLAIEKITLLWIRYRYHFSISDFVELKRIPKELWKLTALENLNLEDLHLTLLPNVIGRLTALKELYISNNSLTTLPDSISQLTALKQLQAEKNLLRSLPNTIGELTALEELDLSDNPLTTFPDSISQLTSLQMLRLGSCHIESLPDAIGGLTALQCLFLYNNALSSLPSTIIQLTALKGLLLPFNRFKTFPSIVCTLTSLQGLWISHNQISSFPAELCNLPALIQLDFSSQSSNDTSANEVDWEEWLKKTFGD